MKIFVVQRNADMTEGRGPMIPVKYFRNRENAVKWFNTQPGIMGRSPCYTSKLTGKQYNGWLDWEYAEWQLTEVETED